MGWTEGVFPYPYCSPATLYLNYLSSSNETCDEYDTQDFFAVIVIYVIVNDSITTRMNDLLSLVGHWAFHKLPTISLKVA